jgi:hypothetical protein
VEPALIGVNVSANEVPYRQCLRNPNTTNLFVDQAFNYYDDAPNYYDDYYYDDKFTLDDDFDDDRDYYSNPPIAGAFKPFFNFNYFPYLMLQCSEDSDVPVSTSSTVLRYVMHLTSCRHHSHVL